MATSASTAPVDSEGKRNRSKESVLHRDYFEQGLRVRKNYADTSLR